MLLFTYILFFSVFKLPVCVYSCKGFNVFYHLHFSLPLFLFYFYKFILYYFCFFGNSFFNFFIFKLEKNVTKINYFNKLSLSNKNSSNPIIKIPSSVIQLLLLSLTTIIFLKLSPIFINGLSS